MANLLQNMLTLQNEHGIPMRMDLSTHTQINYYDSMKNFENSHEKDQLLNQVIADLEQREQDELEKAKSEN